MHTSPCLPREKWDSFLMAIDMMAWWKSFNNIQVLMHFLLRHKCRQGQIALPVGISPQ